jgi:probable HAF family extracellular repeat protein
MPTMIGTHPGEKGGDMTPRVPPLALSLALSACAASGLTAATAAQAAAATAYTMTDLGSLGLGVSVGLGINATGEVVGSYTKKTVEFKCGAHICTATISHPFSWIAGKMTDLGTLGGICSEARAVNGTGDVVGGSSGDVFLVHNGEMTDLGPGAAFGINDFGEIAGSTSCCHALVISGGTRTTLPGLSSYGGGISGASGINNNHQIVGGSGTAQGYVPAVMWANGTITGLGTLAGPQIAPFAQSTATAISNLGQVTGWAQTNTYATHGFLFSNGTMTDIGNIVPEAINDNGMVVGYGALISSGGTVQDLSNLIPPGSGLTPGNATAVNDNGQIVASGYNSIGQEHAFLLTPS